MKDEILERENMKYHNFKKLWWEQGIKDWILREGERMLNLVTNDGRRRLLHALGFFRVMGNLFKVECHGRNDPTRSETHG